MRADSDQVLEQYKLFVEMADRVSERRLKTNQFYIGIISGLLGVITFILQGTSIEFLTEHKGSALLIVGVLGLSLNLIWFINIRSFRQLNTGKFKVIHEMEALLPFQPYDREWDIIKRGEKKDDYFQLSRIEQYLPLVLAIPFLILLFLAFF
jgi:hypothetical protein